MTIASIKTSIYTQRCDQRGCHDIRPLQHFLTQIQEASDVARQQGSSLLILPGHSLGFRTEFHFEYNGIPNPRYSERSVNEGISHLQEVADKFEITLLGEVDKTYWFRPRQTLVALPKQLVVQGSDSDSLKRKLLDVLVAGERDLVLDGVRFRTLLCGENNVLTAPPSKPLYLPEGSEWDWQYNVLVNPGHDTMGNWNKIKRRFDHWSKEGRIVMYTVNNIKNSWSTAMRIYRNGHLIIDGNLDTESNNVKHVQNRWRVVTIEI